MKNILVTGGCGYIGSHTVVELFKKGYNPIIVDNLYNSSDIVLERIEKIVNKRPTFFKGDILDKDFLDKIFSENDIFAIIHFAGLKAVGESVEKPLEYYENNVAGTVNLLEVMRDHNVKNFVFSSSATVYGDQEIMPLDETMERKPATNPYGNTKAIIEDILRDLYISDNSFNLTILRYFNPIGAHESGTMGEDPKGIPNNLLPYVSQVAIGKREKLSVWGNDYDTVDGTGVRDYVHVVDLAIGHIKALDKIEEIGGLNIYNLGTGKGSSVLEIVDAFSKACGFDIPYEIKERRAGDVATCYANVDKAKKELDFSCIYSIEDMVESTWKWQSKNPNGYEK